MAAEVPVAVWSAAFYAGVTRLAVVGVLTGTLTGASTAVSSELLAGGGVSGAALALWIGALAGGLVAVPVIALSAATALVVAARRPRRRGATAGLLVLWPVLAVVTAGWWAFGLSPVATGARVLGTAITALLVAVAVVAAARWVLRPLSG